MQIGTLESLSLENLSPKKNAEAQSAVRTAPVRAAVEPEAQAESLGMDFSELDKVHSLDFDRVASLIADPFGED
ncbi:MAG: hypothetical protein V3573_11975 [Desulfovibrionaceae bacterium]